MSEMYTAYRVVTGVFGGPLGPSLENAIPEPETRFFGPNPLGPSLDQPGPDLDHKPEPKPQPAKRERFEAEVRAEAAKSGSGRRPELYERIDGRQETFVERAARFRSYWELDGYPACIKPRHTKPQTRQE